MVRIPVLKRKPANNISGSRAKKEVANGVRGRQQEEKWPDAEVSMKEEDEDEEEEDEEEGAEECQSHSKLSVKKQRRSY